MWLILLVDDRQCGNITKLNGTHYSLLFPRPHPSIHSSIHRDPPKHLAAQASPRVGPVAISPTWCVRTAPCLSGTLFSLPHHQKLPWRSKLPRSLARFDDFPHLLPPLYFFASLSIPNSSCISGNLHRKLAAIILIAPSFSPSI